MLRRFQDSAQAFPGTTHDNLILMNWITFQQEIKSLSQKVDQEFDIIVAIKQGGMIPACLLLKELKLENMFCVTVEKEKEGRKLRGDIIEKVSGKRILLVEDMLETGRSLKLAKEYLESQGAMVKTASLYIMPISEVQPDYFLREVKEVVEFPWE